MQAKPIVVSSEYQEILKYIATIQGRSVASLVEEILDEWLEVNYCEAVADAEKRHGIPTTIVLRRGKLDSHAAYRVMAANLRELTV